jgi:hypothetical protein
LLPIHRFISTGVPTTFQVNLEKTNISSLP